MAEIDQITGLTEEQLRKINAQHDAWVRGVGLDFGSSAPEREGWGQAVESVRRGNEKVRDSLTKLGLKVI
ncbi:hypothetical protein A3D00_04945 [Candidatus Woesebacteria bacterium RIFCSPHIGHO2_02_FULL_38_9]|uniref:Uncharacterized protein n=1 Tax=Candidatus Woesebacteria bacterium RIFCSPHIGHO2_01_FULL_39_28 TaxID=1802496 RepID=A0A1F7YBW9_9BACT|nr:MAG: hypothetical protein A2627_03535 [Candidatus Woesebacteria bacterium RIFCSPHIGHO2_01_FULL_39_28]OGM34993.1 MAG: hypothetical protein A3D00_04945 [Candidatus Woesebacteria bacterium RIFCSPHIGHO2_02_FULL_38_9]OGM57420.1 MAG: hypothetical protein A3A50_05810 [Candidatus Woesebacteria bacterium RIFCSPLOWO2_01_FULL_38_20]